MIPISWNEMICPETYMKEQRKIAKVLMSQDNLPQESHSSEIK